MKKRWIIFICILAVFVFFLAGLFVVAQNYLNSEGFQEQVIAEMSSQFQCEIHLEKMKIRFWRGADLIGIHATGGILGSHGFLNAERLRLRYDLYEALFHQKIVLEELKLSTPEMKLDLNRDSLSVEKRTPSPSSIHEFDHEKQPSEPVSSSKAESLWPSPPSLSLRNFAIHDGSLMLILPNGDAWDLKGIQIQAALSTEPESNAMGNIQCRTIDSPQKIKIHGAKTSFLWRTDLFTIPKLTAQVLGGFLEGNFTADRTKTEIPLEWQLTIRDLDTWDLMRTLKLSHEEVRGRLQVQSRFQGVWANSWVIQGQGQARLEEGRITNFMGLNMLGGYLNQPGFSDLSLKKCELDFSFSSGRLNMMRFNAASNEIQLTGDGWIDFPKQTQEFQMKLVLHEKLARQLPENSLRGSQNRKDGYVEVPFRSWGSWKDPQDDLRGRFQEMAIQAVGGSIFNKIFQSIPEKQPAKN